MSYLKINRRVDVHCTENPTLRSSFYSEELEANGLLIVNVKPQKKRKKFRKFVKGFWTCFKFIIKLLGIIIALDKDNLVKLF
jgi:hypothetical protein